MKLNSHKSIKIFSFDEVPLFSKEEVIINAPSFGDKHN